MASACLWDQDTLAEEATGNMDYIRVITGRFERNPPLYYKMRLDRVTKELKSDPSKLDNYDNAAVACDRLGDDKQAIVWIEMKRKYMETHGLTPKSNPDDWYRYYANAGAFHTHLWFHDGANVKNLKEIERGRNLLEKALVINPESHFGRERVQLATINWVIDREQPTLAEDFERRQRGRSEAIKDAKGLAGLVLLGNAWESVDLFAALQNRLSMAHHGSLAQFAGLRAKELVRKGRKPLGAIDHLLFEDYPYYHPDESLAKFNEGEYARLRAEADAWASKREAFMLSRLKSGKHPDTDPAFWNGYKEDPAPTIRSQPYFATPHGRMALLMALVVGVLIVIIAIPIVAIVIAVRRRRRRKSPAPQNP